MRKAFALIGTLFLVGCSIEMEEIHPVVERVFLQEEATMDDITCILEGSYPHVKNLYSVQVEININAAFDAFATKVKDSVRDCPAYHAESTGGDVIDTTSVEYEVTVLTDQLLSVKMVSTQMVDGAAYPRISIDTFVFDLSVGQPIGLAEYFSDTPGYEEILENAVVTAMEREGMDIDSTVRNSVEKFYLTNTNLVLVDLFDVHALKAFEVHIPLSNLEEETDS